MNKFCLLFLVLALFSCSEGKKNKDAESVNPAGEITIAGAIKSETISDQTTILNNTVEIATENNSNYEREINETRHEDNDKDVINRKQPYYYDRTTGQIRQGRPMRHDENTGEIIFTVSLSDYDPTPQVYESFQLWEYSPFSLDNRLATLDGRARLRIESNLPFLDGATAFYPLYAAFAKAVFIDSYWNDFRKFQSYHRDMESAVRLSRTANAYTNLLNATVDIIFCLEPSQSQLQQFRSRNIDLQLVPIGREAFVFFTHKDNPVSNVTIDDIKGIYSGNITNWRALGGSDNSIIAFQRPADSGSQTILERVMGNIPIVKPPREVISEMGSMIDIVASYRNYSEAIGYSFLIYATEMVQSDQIKLLSINGVYPSTETIQDGTYPFSQNIYAIYTNYDINHYGTMVYYPEIGFDSRNEKMWEFIQWILSPQGQLLVSRTGYVPINNQ